MQTLHPGSPSRATPQTETLARRLGMTEHVSCLLQKARRLGLRQPENLEQLALDRGCDVYFERSLPLPDESDSMSLRETPPSARASESLSEIAFSNEELAVALLSIGLPYSQHRIRLAGAVLGTPGLNAKAVAHLAVQERNEAVVRHIAELACKVEPENAFWTELVRLLRVRPINHTALPDISRFVAMTGYTRKGKGTVMQWIRPFSRTAA